MKQLELFDDGSPNIEVKLYQIGDNWNAVVNNGWYLATGASKRAALVSVAKRLEAELQIIIDIPKNL